MTKPDILDEHPTDPGHQRPVLVRPLLYLAAILVAALVGWFWL